MVVRVATRWIVEQALRSAARISGTQPGTASQHAIGEPGGLLGTRGIGARAADIVIRVIPIAAPLADLAGHADHPTPTAIERVLARCRRPLELSHVFGEPAGLGEGTIGVTLTARVQPLLPV